MEKPPNTPPSFVVIPETMEVPKSPSLFVPSEMSKWPSLRGLVCDWQDLIQPLNADRNSNSFDDFDWSENYLKGKSACLSRFLYSDRNKFRNLKLLFILLVGVIYGLLITIILHFSLAPSLNIMVCVGLIVSVAVSLALIFCYASRCVLSLVVPSLGTKQGKTILIAILVTQLMSGPLGNLTYNLEQTSHSLACFSNMTVNQTKDIKESIEISLYNFTQNFTSHYLNQVKVGSQAVATVGQEMSSILCRALSLFCGVPTQIKNEVTNTFKKGVNYDENKEQLTSTNKTVQEAKHSLNATLRNVKEEVDDHFRKYLNVHVFLKLATIFSLLYLLFSCWMYYSRFIHVLSFDNVYATKLLKRYDRHCSERGGAQLFPLRPREKVKIIDSVSLSMSQFERKALLISLVLYMVQCIVTIILYVADWTLYTFMEIIIRNVNQSGSGWNETATFRVDSINFELNVPFSFDAKKCLVVPRKVSEDSVIILVVVYIILGFAVLSQAYCLRFRHAIAAYFYPERNSERVQYLYNKLLRKRERSKMTLKFQFPFRKANSVKTIQIVPEPAVPGFCKKVKQNGLNVWRKIGLFRRYCFICGFQENSEFKQCKNFPDCSNIYCPSCFDDRNNTCIVCDN